MAITGGKPISGLVELNPLVGTEEFVVRSLTQNLRVPYSTLLSKISSDLTVSNTMTTEGDMLYFTSSQNTRLPIGSEDQFLRVSGGVPVWETVPILSDPTTTNGDIIVKSGGTLSRIPIGASGQVLQVGLSGIPEWSNSSNYTDPLTTNGDIVTRNSGVTSRLGVGSNGQVLTVVGGQPSWSSPSSGTLTTNGQLLTYNSGEVALSIGTTGQFLRVSGGQPTWETVNLFQDPLTTNGDIIVRSGGSTGRLPIGTNGQVLTSDGTNVSWEDSSSMGQSISFGASGDEIPITNSTSDDFDYDSLFTFTQLNDTLLIGGSRIIGSVDATTTTISRTTSDASDNGVIQISGGGDFGSSRGASISLGGNESSNTGLLSLNAGDVSGGDVEISTGGLLRVRIDETGDVNLQGNSLSNVLNLQSGSFAEALTTVTNCSTGPNMRMNVIRYGSIVFWSIEGASVTPTSTGFVAFRVDIPFNSNFSSQGDVSGTGSATTGSTSTGGVFAIADTVNNEIQIAFYADSTLNHTVRANGSYLIL